MTSRTKAVLFNAIEEGMPLKQAAMLAGISYDSLNRWRNRGESDGAPPEFSDFCKAFRRSEAIAMQRLVRLVEKAGDRDWKAAAWMLERRFPEDFGKITQLEHSGPGGKATHAFTTVEPEVLQRMRRQSGLVELVGKLGSILQRHQRERDDLNEASRNSMARLRE